VSEVRNRGRFGGFSAKERVPSRGFRKRRTRLLQERKEWGKRVPHPRTKKMDIPHVIENTFLVSWTKGLKEKEVHGQNGLSGGGGGGRKVAT